jgi:hypothetical protein
MLHLTSDSKLVATFVGIICRSKVFLKIWFLGLFFNSGIECGRSGAVIGRSTAVETRYGVQ